MAAQTYGDDKKFIREKLRPYVHAFQYKNVNSSQFVDFVTSNGTGDDALLKEVLEDWVYQPGIPEITISFNRHFNTFRITQESALKREPLLRCCWLTTLTKNTKFVELWCCRRY